MSKLDEFKKEVVQEVDEKVSLKIIEKATAEYLKKIINKSETMTEVQFAAQIGEYYKRTGFTHLPVVEKFSENICYFSKNSELSFCQDDKLPQNLFIIGENYKVLQNLLITYRGRVKMIYIDPPYGKDKMGDFANMNYDNEITRDDLLSSLDYRIRLAIQLLSPDGVLFCSIDDRNQSYIKCLLDELFGENRILFNIPRITKKRR